MTTIADYVVAKRDGVLKAPDGTRYRMHAGGTLAHREHPAVIANPQAWAPAEIDLDVIAGSPEAEESGKLIDEAYGYLNDIANLLHGRGLIDEADTEPGWLVRAVARAVGAEPASAAALPEPEAEQVADEVPAGVEPEPVAEDEAEDVAPPTRSRRKAPAKP